MIRFATKEELPRILAIYAPYVTASTVSFEYDVPTLAEFTHRFEAITAQFPWLVWEEGGQILGYAYASAPFERAAYRWIAEPSIYLHPDALRRGIGAKLYGALEGILQQQGYGLLYALITAENETSIAFHQKLGYSHMAQFPNCAYKQGKCLSVVWMEKSLPFVEYPSAFPKPWFEIVDSDQKFY